MKTDVKKCLMFHETEFAFWKTMANLINITPNLNIEEHFTISNDRWGSMI
jgi:hypothetical protein